MLISYRLPLFISFRESHVIKILLFFSFIRFITNFSSLTSFHYVPFRSVRGLTFLLFLYTSFTLLLFLLSGNFYLGKCSFVVREILPLHFRIFSHSGVFIRGRKKKEIITETCPALLHFLVLGLIIFL